MEILHEPTILTHHLIDYYMCSLTQPKTRKDTTDSTLFVQQPSCLVSQETWLRPPPHWPISDTAPPLARRILPGSNCGAVLPHSLNALAMIPYGFEVGSWWSWIEVLKVLPIIDRWHWVCAAMDSYNNISHDKSANMLHARKLKFEKFMAFWLGRSFYEKHGLTLVLH